MKRRTGKEIVDRSVSDEERHTWLATAKIDEVYEFIRWAAALGSWAAHGRDRLNVLLASENIKLQKDIRDMTDKMNKMTKWVTGLTVVIVFLTLIQAYSSVKTLYDDIKPFINAPKTYNTTNQPASTNQLKDSQNESLNKTKIINHEEPPNK